MMVPRVVLFQLVVYIIIFMSSAVLSYAVEKKPDSHGSLIEEPYYALLDSSRAFLHKDLRKSLYFADQARGYADSLEQPDLFVKLFNQYGRIYFRGGLSDISTEYYLKSYEIIQSAVDLPTSDRLSTLLGMGINYLFLRNYDRAEDYFLQIQELLETLPEPDYKILSAVINNLGIIYRERNDLVQANNCLDQGIKKIAKFDPENENLGNLYNNLGLVFAQMKNYEAALETFAFGGKEALRKDNIHALATNYSFIAKTYREMGDATLAIRYGRRGNQLAAKGEILVVQHNCSELLADLYKEMLMPDSALFFFEEKERLFREIDQSKAEQNLLTQSLKEMHALEMEKLVAESKNSNRKLFSFLLITFLILAVLILLYVTIRRRYHRVRLERKKLLLVFQQRERERELLQAKIQEKSKQLTTKMLYETKRQRIIKDTVDKLVGNRNEFSKQGKKIVSSIVGELSQFDQDKILSEFEVSFLDLHTGFYKNLLDSFPNLSPNERRLCAFIRLNLNSSEISALTGQSKSTLNMAKTRLRKKLGVTHSNVDLYDFLSRF